MGSRFLSRQPKLINRNLGLFLNCTGLQPLPIGYLQEIEENNEGCHLHLLNKGIMCFLSCEQNVKEKFKYRIDILSIFPF